MSLDAKVERQAAVDLFNHVWTLLDRVERTRDEDDEMLHAASTSTKTWRRWSNERGYSIGCHRVWRTRSSPVPRTAPAGRS